MSEIYVKSDREQAIESARTDLNFFAALCLPEIFRFLFPGIYVSLWQWLSANLNIEEGMHRLALGLPRGFGKTIFLKLIVVYTILFTDRRFILAICNTADLAENFIADVCDVLDSDNIRNLFGNWRLTLEKDALHFKKFYFRGRPIILAGLGVGSSPRGLNVKYVRPDFIIMDDMQSKEQAESPVESGKIFSWMVGTLLKTNDPKRCLYVFVGNMYPYPGSILKKLKHASTWISFITSGINEHAESLWPELKPLEVLLAEYKNDCELGMPEQFLAEVMNDENAGVKHGIDLTLIQPAPDYLTDDLAHSGWVIIDPSLGKKKSDNVAIGCFLVHDKPMFRALSQGKFDPKKTVEEAFKLCFRFGCRVIFVENVAYQASLAFWINWFVKELQIEGITALPINPRAGTKNSKIYNTLKTMAKEDQEKVEQLVHEDVRDIFVAQAIDWNPLKQNNVDDVLDLPGFTTEIMTEHPGELERVLQLSVSTNSVQASTEEDLALPF